MLINSFRRTSAFIGPRCIWVIFSHLLFDRSTLILAQISSFLILALLVCVSPLHLSAVNDVYLRGEYKVKEKLRSAQFDFFLFFFWGDRIRTNDNDAKKTLVCQLNIPAVISPPGPAICKPDPSFPSLSGWLDLSFIDFKLPPVCCDPDWGLVA